MRMTRATRMQIQSMIPAAITSVIPCFEIILKVVLGICAFEGRTPCDQLAGGGLIEKQIV